MPVDVSGALRQALTKLETEKTRIDRQIVALKQALIAGRGAALDSQRPTTTVRGKRRRRPPMSVAARRAASKRMKAYWAKRKAGKKGKAKVA